MNGGLRHNTGTLERWNAGALEHWNTGTLEHWNTGTLAYCNGLLTAMLNWRRPRIWS
jgi:hypothetical protein